MSWKTVIGALLLVASSNVDWAESFGEYPLVEENLTPNGKILSNGINKFGFDSYKHVAEKEGNQVFSPFSMSLALGLLYYMTKGECATEITTALSLQQNPDEIGDGYQSVLEPTHNGSMDIGNRAFVDNSFKLKQSYLDNVEKYLNAESESVAFSAPNNATDHINSWVSEKTHGKISELFSKGIITVDTRIVLVNTLYFKNVWHFQFQENDTRELPFHLEDGTTQQVPMMKLESDLGYGDIRSLDSKVLVLPYKGGNHNMIIILPNENAGLSKLEKALTHEVFVTQIMSSVIYGRTVKALIPKFKLDKPLKLKETWKKLGIRKVFDFSTADFSNGVDKDEGLEVSSVEHRACIEVDEKGTVAAAATGAAISTRSSHSIPLATPLFRADHPFIFAVTDVRTNVILFLGRYVTPP